MSVIVSELVFEAKIVPSPHRPSSSPKRAFFASSSSTIASITTSQPASSATLVVKLRRFQAASRSSAESFPFSTARSMDLAILPRPASSSSSLTSRTITSKPLLAATSATPLPMSPQPITPTSLMSNPTSVLFSMSSDEGLEVRVVLGPPQVPRHSVKMPLDPAPPRRGRGLE